MRGHPDIGSISSRCEVEPHKGGFRGVLSIPFDGTRHTDVYESLQEAQQALDAMSGSVLPKPKSNGFNAAQQADIAAAIGAM